MKKLACTLFLATTTTLAGCVTPPLQVDTATLEVLPPGAGWGWLQRNASKSTGLLCEFADDGRTVNMRYDLSTDGGVIKRNFPDRQIYASWPASSVRIYNRFKAYGIEVWISSIPGLKNPSDICIFEIIPTDSVEGAEERFSRIATAAHNAGIEIANR